MATPLLHLFYTATSCGTTTSSFADTQYEQGEGVGVVLVLSLSLSLSLSNRCVTDPAYEEVNNAFERALVFLHKVTNKKQQDCIIA